jgi:hypothetical protein
VTAHGGLPEPKETQMAQKKTGKLNKGKKIEKTKTLTTIKFQY